MAGRVKADCEANLMQHSCPLNGARLTLVARDPSLIKHRLCVTRASWIDLVSVQRA